MKRKRFLLVAGIAALMLGCRQPHVEKVVTTAVEVPASASSSARLEASPLRKGSCGTLLDVEAPDTLRLTGGDRGLVLYANEQVGLAIVDVTNPDQPSVRGVIELDGDPAGVFYVRGVAVLVYSPAAHVRTVAVRAIGLEPARTLGEVSLPGVIRDVRRIGEHIVVTRQSPDGGTVVTAFGVTESGSGIVKQGEIALTGGAAVAGAAPSGLVVARAADIANRTAVTWIALDPELGVLMTRGTAIVSGAIPSWRSSHRVIDVTEDARVRLMLCETGACDLSGPAAYASIDFSTPAEPRVTSWKLVAGAGDGTIGFMGTRLVVARPALDRSDASELAFYDTERDLATVGRVRIRGSVGSIVVRDSGDVVTVGWTGSVSAGKRAVLHHIDARGVPRLVGAASFGGDWSWTRAYDDERALAFDPTSTLAALPMTTVHGKEGPISAAQVFSFEATGPRSLSEEKITYADRLLFANGRLLSFSPDGVVVLGREGEQGVAQRWERR